MSQSFFGPETQAALDALKQGQPVVGAETTNVDDTETEGTLVEFESAETDASGIESTEEDESQTSDEPVIQDATLQQAIEEIWVDDGKGRKKVKVDFNNKEELKKLAAKAYGMDKFRLERDKALEWKKQNESKLTELQEAWDALEQAHKTQGIKGLVTLLTGEQDAYDKYVEKIVADRKLRESASPEELERIEAMEKAEQMRREAELMREELKREREAQAQAKEAAAQRDLQSKLTPAFNKWSFDGKLGDAQLEEQYNTALWQLSINKLKALPDDVDLSAAVVNKTFQEVASGFHKAVSTQTKKKVAETTQKRKDAASTKAASIATKGTTTTSADVEQFKGHIKSGNIVDSLKMFMSGKVKLK